MTGASTGIGKSIVDALVGRGVQVFAGVRDLSSVAEHPLVTPLRLEVTSAEEALEAAAGVRETLAGKGIYGLINNAGIAIAGPLEVTPLDEWRRQFEVNVIGQVNVTQAFLPLLRSNGSGRIVFTSSIAGRVAMPYMGPYSASKHALNAIAESLRRELVEWNIGVTCVAPGTIATPIWEKSLAEGEAALEALTPEQRGLYGDSIKAVMGLAKETADAGIAPEKVAAVTMKALYARHPRPEYLVGNDALGMAAADTVLPHRVFDKVVARELGKHRT